MPRNDIVLSSICGQNVSIFYMYSVLNTFKADTEGRFGGDLLTVLGPYIHRNRNEIRDEFMASGKEWLFSLDIDMVFNPGDIFAVVKVADEKGPGIYSAAYQLEDGVLVCGPWDDKVPMVYHPMTALPSDVAQVGMVGMGFTMIHREVFEAIDEAPFAAITPQMGEDVAFCWRAYEAGYSPWLVPEANPGHAKSVVLFPHGEMRNRIGSDINLVSVPPTNPGESDT